MWDEDWALLGIEPTIDLAAIKKAYALKLKTTRPDDDAQAYQALRAAYERAQQWARWEQQRPQDEVATEVKESVAALAPAPEPTPEPAPEPDEPLPAEVGPQALVADFHAYWRDRGDDALMAAWPALSHRLDDLPLSRRDEFSAAFAHWVLSEPNLPDALVSALNQQFGWLTDFRAERQIGPGLVQALHQALDGRLVDHTAGPDLRRYAEPLLHLHRVLDRWWGAAAPVMAAVIGPVLERLLRSLDGGNLRRLGLRERERKDLTTALDISTVLRYAICLLPLGLLGFAQQGRLDTVGWSALGWLACGVGGLAFAWVGGAALWHGLLPQRMGERYHAWLHRLRGQPWAPWLGLALLAAAGWLARARYGMEYAFDQAELAPLGGPVDGVQSIRFLNTGPLGAGYAADLLGSLAMGLAGLVIAWPRALTSGRVLAGQVMLLTYVIQVALEGTDNGLLRGLKGPDVMDLFQGGTPVIATWFWCWAWLILGGLVYEQRVAGANWLVWVVRPVTNVLGLGERWGLHFAIVPAFLTCGVLWLLDVELRTGSKLFLWAVLVVALSHLQAALENRGLRWLARLAGQG